MATKTTEMVIPGNSATNVRKILKCVGDVFLNNPIDSVTITITRVPAPSKVKPKRLAHVFRRNIAGAGTLFPTHQFLVCKNCRERKGEHPIGRFCHPLPADALRRWDRLDAQNKRKAAKRGKG